MAQTIKLKRSAVAGKVPTTSDLALGEVGMNTWDGKLFLKKDNGAESIVEIGARSPIAETAQVINSNVELSAGSNGFSVGPVEVAATYAVTVPANATWLIAA